MESIFENMQGQTKIQGGRGFRYLSTASILLSKAYSYRALLLLGSRQFSIRWRPSHLVLSSGRLPERLAQV